MTSSEMVYELHQVGFLFAASVCFQFNLLFSQSQQVKNNPVF